MSRNPSIWLIIVLSREDQKTRYMPVQEATLGVTPKAIISGLKIVPPPRPREPAIRPPRKLPIRIVYSPLPSNRISP
jgi:hypothetical protein